MLNKNKLGNIWLYAVSALTLAEALGKKFDHIIKLDKSTQCHQLNQFGSTWLLDSLYQVLMSSASWFRRRHFWRCLPFMGLEAILVMWPWTFEQIFIQTSHGGSIGNLASNGLSVVWGKDVWKCRIWVSMNGLDCGLSCTYIFVYMYQLSPHRLQQFLGNLQLKHTKINGTRVVIWIYLAVFV